MSLRVFAHIQARPNTIQETEAMLLELIAPTRQEAGCISYQLHKNNADPAGFTFVEEWVSDEALNAHLQTPHLTAALAKIPLLLAGAPDIRRYTLIA